MMRTLLNLQIAIATFAVVSYTALSASAAMVPHFTAKIFDQKDHSKQMFTYKSEFETAGPTKTFVNTVTDMTGKVLVIEKTVVLVTDDAEKLVSFEQDQKQMKTIGRVEVRDGKAFFSLTKDGKTSNDDEKAGSDFIVTSTLVQFVQSSWEKIKDGESLNARLGVVDRKESVGFQFKKEAAKEVEGAAAFVVKMKPSSVIIAALVSPLFFTFAADGKKLLSLEGRTNVKIEREGTLKDFDGYTVYSWAER